MSAPIQLIVGLGNPGVEYEQTRHNAGFWFADAVARGAGGGFKRDSKFHGEACKVRLDGHEVWLLKPQTFMNRSGQAVAALARFYKIPLENILVAHDELDVPPGQLRLKQGGGHAGHNGLRDIGSLMGGAGFLRLRIGIGRPAHSGDVTGFVLGKPPQSERTLIDDAIAEAVATLPLLMQGEMARAMNRLHAKKA